jgi:hypothetical protein
MRAFFIKKSGFLLLLGAMVIISAALVYVFAAGNASQWHPLRATPGTTVSFTPDTSVALTPSLPPKACHGKQRDFQMGIAFPQWTPTGYGQSDTKWLTELPAMRTQTAACWVEIRYFFINPHLPQRR